MLNKIYFHFDYKIILIATIPITIIFNIVTNKHFVLSNLMIIILFFSFYYLLTFDYKKIIKIIDNLILIHKDIHILLLLIIMFLFEKYRPQTINNFLFNKNILEELRHIASFEDIPHIIISGPTGSGKKTLVKFFLEALYDTNINILSKIKYNVSGSSAKKR